MKKSELLFTAIKPPIDYAALILAALAAYFIRYLPNIQKIRPVVFNLSFSDYLTFAILIAIGWIAIFAISGLYSVSGIKKNRDEISRVFVASSAGLALVLAVMVFSRYLFDSRFIIIISWIFAIIFVSLERLIIQLLRRQAYKAGIGVHRIAIIGDEKISEKLSQEFNSHPTWGFRVVCKFPEFSDSSQARLIYLAENDGIDEIIQIRPNHNAEKTLDLINFADEYHIDFKYAADLLGTHL
ncbi:MAG: hypothetical protein WCX71_05500, partial [Candidatus Buchananbacteria bacterium]